jgi:hypothetical protein
MDEHVPKHDGIIGSSQSMRDGVIPRSARLDVNAFRKCMCRSRVQKVPIEVFNYLLVLSSYEGSHSSVRRHVGVDGLRMAKPLNSTLDETSTVVFSYFTD